METYASKLSGPSNDYFLGRGSKREPCINKVALGKSCVALIALLLMAAAVGLGIFFVGDDKPTPEVASALHGSTLYARSLLHHSQWCIACMTRLAAQCLRRFLLGGQQSSKGRQLHKCFVSWV
jgi:hypothetical protein